MSTDSKLAIICITENGKKLALKLHKSHVNSHVYIVNKSNKFSSLENNENITVVESKLSEIVEKLFINYNSILFIMATGIVVRTIAPFIQSKLSDPAILVCDEKGKNIISLLSGHVGGANELTLKLSHMINSNPVITTATDINDKSSLDLIAKKLNAHIDDFRDNVKEINSMLVNNKKVGIYVDGGYDVDTRGFELIDNLDKVDDFEKVVIVTNKSKLYGIKFIKVVPRNIVLGIGCRRNTNSEYLKKSVIDLLSRNEIDINSIKEIGSIDIKFDEKALINLSQELSVPFRVISSDEILKIEDLFDKSEFVKKQVGVYNVSEPVAYILSNGNVTLKKSIYKGVTISMGRVEV